MGVRWVLDGGDIAVPATERAALRSLMMPVQTEAAPSAVGTAAHS